MRSQESASTAATKINIALSMDLPTMLGPIFLENVPVSSINHMLITHLHGDHVNGLEAFAFYKSLIEGERIKLLLSPEIRSSIWNHRLSACMGNLWDGNNYRSMDFDDYFEYLPLHWSEPTSVGPFKIQPKRTCHHIPTSALIVEASGLKLGYSSDTAFDPDLITFLAQADLIIHETNLGPAHTPYDKLAELPSVIREKMRLVHYPDGFDVEASIIKPLQEGECLRIER